MSDLDNKKFLSNANDYIKGVLVYDEPSSDNTRLKLDKMDGTEPVTLIDTRYWNRNIKLRDYNNTSYTIIPNISDLNSDIEFQLPETISNEVSGMVNSRYGNRLLQSNSMTENINSIIIDNSFFEDIDFFIEMEARGDNLVIHQNEMLKNYIILKFKTDSIENPFADLNPQLQNLQLSITLQNTDTQSEVFSDFSVLDIDFDSQNQEIIFALEVEDSFKAGDSDQQGKVFFTISPRQTLNFFLCLTDNSLNSSGVLLSNIPLSIDRTTVGTGYSYDFEMSESIIMLPIKETDIEITNNDILLKNYNLNYGENNTISGNNNIAFGEGLKNTSDKNSLVLGQYNLSNPNAYFIIGNGTSDDNRKNLMTVTGDSITFNCDVYCNEGFVYNKSYDVDETMIFDNFVATGFVTNDRRTIQFSIPTTRTFTKNTLLEVMTMIGSLRGIGIKETTINSNSVIQKVNGGYYYIDKYWYDYIPYALTVGDVDHPKENLDFKQNSQKLMFGSGKDDILKRFALQLLILLMPTGYDYLDPLSDDSTLTKKQKFYNQIFKTFKIISEEDTSTDPLEMTNKYYFLFPHFIITPVARNNSIQISLEYGIEKSLIENKHFTNLTIQNAINTLLDKWNSLYAADSTNDTIPEDEKFPKDKLLYQFKDCVIAGLHDSSNGIYEVLNNNLLSVYLKQCEIKIIKV